MTTMMGSLARKGAIAICAIAALTAMSESASARWHGGCWGCGAFAAGAIHELLIRLEAAGPASEGAADKARQHFNRAVALSKGRRVGPYVSLAEAVALPEEDRAEFIRLLEQALSIDPAAAPGDRVANLVAQQRARDLLDHVDDLFVIGSSGGAASRRRQP